MSIMLDDPLHIPKEADGELLKKIMADSAALSIDKALERLYVSREKQKIILKSEQETALKELLAGRNVMARFANTVRQKLNIHQKRRV